MSDKNNLKEIFNNPELKSEDSKFFYKELPRAIFKMVIEGKTVPEIGKVISRSEAVVMAYLSHPAFMRRLQTYLIFCDLRKAILQVEETETFRQAVAERSEPPVAYGPIQANNAPKIFPTLDTKTVVEQYHKLLMDKNSQKALNPELIALIIAAIGINKRKLNEPEEKDSPESGPEEEGFGYETTNFDDGQTEEANLQVASGDENQDEQRPDPGI